MDLILCHITADFDTLGAAIGLSRLLPGSRIVLAGGAHPTVRDFLALHRDEYALIERRSVNPQSIRSLSVVDSQRRDRLGKVAEWLDLPDIPITLYDHHSDTESDIFAQDRHVEAVGATTTLIVERLQIAQILLTAIEATAMALGIHVDTGSLTFDHATPRDASALAWLMGQGANLRAIAEYIDPGLSPTLQDLLGVALENLQSKTVQGYTVSWVILKTDDYVPGLSSLASRLVELTESDALLLLHRYCRGVDCRVNEANVLSVIGRSRIEGTNLNELFKPWGGGGHPKAAALTLRDGDFQEILTQLLTQFEAQIPPSLTARELMSSPVRTIRPDTTIDEAQRILLRYGHSGLSVVDANDQLVGIISRRDLDIAFYHGFGHAPVKGYMTTNLKTIAPDARLPEIESLMVTYDIGRLPVLDQGQLVGIVTRTDVLRQLHQADTNQRPDNHSKSTLQSPKSKISLDRLSAHLQEFLSIAANQAEQHGWHLYLVGGAVRDLLLTDSDQPVMLTDIDLVVDGFHRSADVGAGVELARSLQRLYPDVRLDIHGRFQTAALLWHKDPTFDSLWVDIATARTEFYPYPAANPEVEASSIRQDLYRRDFTINAMALRLTNPRFADTRKGPGELLDFFGGSLDLQAKQIRVLHPNSFIEDPTRIYRAVRFATRLGFEIEPQTERYIRHAIASGIYEQIQDRQVAGRVIAPALQTRLKSELKYILQSSYWKAALNQLAHLGALRCIHPKLELDDELRWQLRSADRWLHRLDRSQLLPSWQLLLEVLIAHLAPDDRASVAQNLQLSADGIDRLVQLEPVRSKLESLSISLSPSQIVQYLKPYELPLLILVAVKSSRAIRKQIWRYLTIWSTVKPPLDGNDLKALGYKPGRQFKQILDDLLSATLDGRVHDRAEAEAYLAQHHAPNS
ncbi:CBS domain-containing protein [Phormidesmis priestleyi ULC007]|uniref:CBS domain-containing protein n=1 Tax=Phormidesmis priestleyi ULC007 TaxID=1920490 RepID=A0A2T1D6Q5_9CYAN|nr:CBS domain-containing protein [Phormidesmis priestleyi]PSB16114.1 CBS domain-containing protein [Phormidesmis priestleyi ULC007]PZO50498.1 MAG: CBS domain-containing protein [Phormidesmis priestleyi]